MRTPPNAQTGKLGETGVTRAFERLNWGVADNSRHDVGTDLLAMARDERGVELCLVIGVQVKTRGVGEGPGKYFSARAYDESGAFVGWWFRDDDRRHVDSWLRYEIPHLLVLHDANDSASYWVHITEKTVVATGKGVKVLVPVDQTLDLDHRDQLLAVAATQRPGVPWEGSAWRGPQSLQESALLRHAVIVPRLVAPHANSALTDPLTPEQAVALLVRAQLPDLQRRLDLPPLDDDLAAALDRPGWRWRLAKALLRRVTTGEHGELLAVLDSAATPGDRTVATVLAAAGLLEVGDAEAADRLVVAALNRDDAEPVDHAWLSLQHARCLGEVGRVDEAREHVLAGQGARRAFPDDVTASAIGGIAAMTLYRLTQWGEGKDADLLGDGVSGIDTAAVWWRTFDASAGLRASADDAYRSWGRDTGITWRARDTANDDLFAASLMAGYLGDQGGWSSLSAQYAKESLRRLDRSGEVEEAREALSTLVSSGDHKSTTLATRRLVLDGPADAAARVAAACRLDTATRTTARATLSVLRIAGDILDADTADRTAGWLLETLTDPSAFVDRVRPTFLLVPELVKTLARVIGACSHETQRTVTEYLAGLPGQEHELVAQAWSNVARAIPRKRWHVTAAARFGAVSPGHHEVLRVVALEVAAHHDASAREALVALVGEGSGDALSAFGDVRDLPVATARGHVDRLATACDRIRERARQLSRTEGADRPEDLALLNAWHPTAARWEPLLDLLADPMVWPQDKHRALRLLARLPDQLPDAATPRLRQIAEQLLAAERHPAGLFDERDETRGAALDLAYSLADRSTPVSATWRSHLLDLLAGDRHDRHWVGYVARHCNEPAGAGILAVLLQDDDPLVRAEATSSMLHRADCDPAASSLVDEALARAVADPGTTVARNVVGPITRCTTIAAARRPELLQRLAEHRSAAVRSQAAAALSSLAGEAAPFEGADGRRPCHCTPPSRRLNEDAGVTRPSGSGRPATERGGP